MELAAPDLFQWFPMDTICTQHLPRGWRELGTPWAASGNPGGDELEASTWCREGRGADVLSQQLGQSCSPQMNSVHLNTEKVKENSCAFRSLELLELLSSCAPGKLSIPLLPKGFLNWNILLWNQKIEGFKSSLAFDGETGKKLGIQADKFRISNYCLTTEAEQLKTLIAAMEHREKVMEKLAPVSDTLWLSKSVHYTDPGTEVFGTIMVMIKPQRTLIPNVSSGKQNYHFKNSKNI